MEIVEERKLRRLLKEALVEVIYEEALSKTKAAMKLGVCRKTVYNYIEAGLLHTTTTGKIPLSEIIRFKKDNLELKY